MTKMETKVMLRKIVLMFLLILILLGMIYQINKSQSKMIYVFLENNSSPAVENPQGVQASLHKQVDSLVNNYEQKRTSVRNTVIP